MYPRGRHGGPPWARGNDTPPPADDVAAWLTGRLPDEWYEGSPEVQVDRDEIVVIGELTAPTVEGDPDEAARQAAIAGRITRFREETRGKRIAIAQEAEERYGRKVAWGAKIGDTSVVFTSLAVPVMTRLRFEERQVLDTLVDAGVARSRSEALAWAVKLVGQHEGDWIQQLRDALVAVQEARKAGPAS
ncbi:MAG: hypothetical protein QOF82_2436 [Frankiales bacterium]|jgi:hypothetical protein|nr:hypothetical protein [Frankiales bacterium]